MEIQHVVYARVDGRDDERLAADDEAEVAEERFIHDRVDRLALVDPALGMATDTRALRRCGHVHLA